MKLKGIILIFGLLMSGMTYAQAPGGQRQGRMDPAERAKRQTEQMVTDLGLNADQTKKVEAINTKYGEEMAKLFQERRTADGDFTQIREKMKTMNEEKNKELKTVLSEDQMKKYLELEQKRLEERRQRRSGGQGGTPPARRGQQRGGGN